MEATNSIQVTTPIVAQQLFDPIAHEAIKAFICDRVPMMSVADDPSEFVRNYAHNVPFFVNIHRQLTDFASDTFGEKLKPSYSFLSMYRKGGKCPLHIDRPQCYRTVDYLIQQDNFEDWPICIGAPMTDEQRLQINDDGEGHPSTEDAVNTVISSETWTEVVLEPNDAVLYSGTHQWHYRPKVLNGTADLVFFHFVPADFEGSLD